jgi:hypothetical protein
VLVYRLRFCNSASLCQKIDPSPELKSETMTIRSVKREHVLLCTVGGFIFLYFLEFQYDSKGEW